MKEQLSTYELICKNHWEEAISLAEFEFTDKQDIFELRQSVIALLNLKKYDEVLIKNQIIKGLDIYSTSTEYGWDFIAFLFKNEIEKAIDSLIKQRKCQFTDMSGGIEYEAMMYIIADRFEKEKLKAQALLRMNKLSSKIKYNLSPYNIVARFLNGSLEYLDVKNLYLNPEFIEQDRIMIYLYVYWYALKVNDDEILTQHNEYLENIHCIKYFKYEFYLMQYIKKNHE